MRKLWVLIGDAVQIEVPDDATYADVFRTAGLTEMPKNSQFIGDDSVGPALEERLSESDDQFIALFTGLPAEGDEAAPAGGGGESVGGG